uniref:Uncharacterized protein n=1 Tax=Panagrolaimus sp. JU765 TaxID=591449 RepID=A0AC34RIX7_9BILA
MQSSVLLVFSVVFVTVYGNSCRIERYNFQNSAYNSRCADNSAHGCAVVKRPAKNVYEQPDVEYLCLSEIARLHPLFAVAKCPSSAEHALCYSHDSTDLIEYDMAKHFHFMEQTVGEVLRLHGIEAFCCCKGDNCNQVNRVIEDTVNPRRYLIDTYDENDSWKQTDRSRSEIRSRQYGRNSGILQTFSYVLVTFLLML